jgi:GxxExxY protein
MKTTGTKSRIDFHRRVAETLRGAEKERFSMGGQHERREDQITNAIIGAAIEVHRELGPGLLESAYEECLCHELSLRGLSFERQVPLPVRYKTVLLDCGYRMDLVVEKLIVVDLKTVEKLIPIHEAQLLTYLKLYSRQVGLLVNFQVPALKDGLRRIVNNY